MKQVGVRHTVMLTGDRKEAAETVAQALGIDEVHAELLPGGKVEQVEALLKAEKEKERLAFVGDGINDWNCNGKYGLRCGDRSSRYCPDG